MKTDIYAKKCTCGANLHGMACYETITLHNTVIEHLKNLLK